MNSDEIERYLSLRDSAGDFTLWTASTTVFVMMAAVTICLFVASVCLVKNSDGLRELGTGICILLTMLTFVGTIGIAIDKRNSHKQAEMADKGLTSAYQYGVISNFHVDEEAVREAELDESDPKAGPKIKVEHIDLDSKTHYNLVFIFDKETHEPILLENENVTEEVIEKLSRDTSRVEAASID